MSPLSSAHGLDHFFAEFHRWWERFWISAKYKTKIYVEEAAIILQQQIVEVPTLK